MPLCRACLTERDSFLHELFYDISPEMYLQCTSVDVKMNDGYPLGICEPCSELLNKISEFKSTCINSQNILSMMKPFNQVQDEVSKSSLKHNMQLVTASVGGDLYDSDGSVGDCETGNNVHTEDYKCDIGVQEKPNRKLYFTNKRKKIKLKSRSHLRKEYKPKRKKSYMGCNLCSKKFVLMERFEAHKLEHAGKIVPITCKSCNKSFTTWSSLNRHNNDEHSVFPLESLKCDVCGKISKSIGALLIHKRRHDRQNKQCCHICGKGFSTRSTLQTHLLIHMDIKDTQYTCDQCGKKFGLEKHLKIHVWRAHSTRKYICDCCNFSFKHKYGLVVHLKARGGAGKVHKCDVCQKSYSRRTMLNEHKRLHSGVRPFVCNFCAKSFTTKRTLSGHEKIHTGERPHKCDVCDKSFGQRYSLKRHLNVHSKETKMDK